MQTYKVVRSTGPGDIPHPIVKIWDGGDLLWERDADSYIDFNGKLVQLSELTDTDIIELYRKDHS